MSTVPAMYRVLGPLQVETDLPVSLGPKVGRLLAVLLAARGQTVTVGALAEALWGDEQPADPEGALQTHLSRLRAIVGKDLLTQPPGYAMKVSGDRLDATRFEQELEKSSSMGTAEAIRHLTKAESEWHGAPYVGFEDVEVAAVEAVRLEQLRRGAVEHRLTLMIESGQAQAALPEVEGLVSAEPLSESPVGLLMRALASTGRKPEALRAFDAFERRLAEETGLEPSAALRELEVAILMDQLDPAPAPPAAPISPLPISISYTERAPGEQVAIGRMGSGVPLLVHPGWLAKLDILAAGKDGRSPFIHRLAKDFEIVTFDRFGTGMSPGEVPDVTFDDAVDELVAVTRSIGGGPVPLLASSAAGPIAIAAAVRAPDLFGCLILMGTYASGPALFPQRVSESFEALVRASWGLGSRVLASLIFPDADAQTIDGLARFQRDSASPELAASLLRQMYEADVTEILTNVNVPTQIIHYRQDKAIPFAGGEALARGIPGSKMVALDGIKHFPDPPDYDQVVSVIRETISRV